MVESEEMFQFPKVVLTPEALRSILKGWKQEMTARLTISYATFRVWAEEGRLIIHSSTSLSDGEFLYDATLDGFRQLIKVEAK